MNYNKLIDHTILKPEATLEDVKRICDEAKTYDFAAVCINPCHVAFCAKELQDSDVAVCSVIGFPLGANTTATKVFEATEAIKNGADEIDMVMNIGALKDQAYDLVFKDIQAVVEAANGKCVKVILETCLLDDEEIIKACQLCVEAKATFVKTSTGFSSAGANCRVVKIMKDTVKDACLVKAAGGVRCYDDLLKMVAAGASRIGTSAGVKLMQKGDGN